MLYSRSLLVIYFAYSTMCMLISSPGDCPNPGIEPMSPAWQVASLPAEPQGKPKYTEVGSLSLLQQIFPTQGSNPCLPALQIKWSRSVVSDSLQPHGLLPTRLLRPWDFPGKSTGVGCHFLLQGIFMTQGLDLGLPHCRQMLYHLSHTAGSFFTKWAISEALC